MEDKILARRWAEGSITTDSLLAYSAVCGTGLDTIPYPSDISVDQLARILGDVATYGSHMMPRTKASLIDRRTKYR